MRIRKHFAIVIDTRRLQKPQSHRTSEPTRGTRELDLSGERIVEVQAVTNYGAHNKMDDATDAPNGRFFG